MSCRVRGCRFPTTHITRAHVCGRCKCRGHGQMEHGNYEWIEQLESWSAREPPLPEDMHCTVSRCREPWSHTSLAHHCDTCGVRGICLDCNPSLTAESDSDNDRRTASSLMTDAYWSRYTHTTERVSSSVPTFLPCPMCRTKTSVDGPIYVSGDGRGTCVVCFDDSPLYMFSACRHACICETCLQRIRKNE